MENLSIQDPRSRGAAHTFTHTQYPQQQQHHQQQLHHHPNYHHQNGSGGNLGSSSTSLPGQQQQQQQQQGQQLPIQQQPQASQPQPQQPQGAPQLPPQMFTTAAQLLDLTDKKLLLVLRDGRRLLGVLRTWDQFANLVLADSQERVFVTIPQQQAQGSVKRLYCDIPRGTYLVRGENVLLIGEVDLDKDDDPPPGYELGDANQIIAYVTEAEKARKKRDKTKGRKAAQLWGGDMEGSGEVLF